MHLQNCSKVMMMRTPTKEDEEKKTELSTQTRRTRKRSTSSKRAVAVLLAATILTTSQGVSSKDDRFVRSSSLEEREEASISSSKPFASHRSLFDFNGNNNLPTPRIVDGEDIDDPSTATFFVLSASPNKICGGALIHNDIIVTAAHCLPAFEDQGVLLYDPTTNDYTSQRQIDWYKIYPHHISQQSQDLTGTVSPNNNDNDDDNDDTNKLPTPTPMNYDFMIMRLAYPVDSQTITPIAINRDAENPSDGQVLRAFGYGRTTPTGYEEPPTHLQAGEFQAISNDECRSRVQSMEGAADSIQDDILCTDPTDEASICKGDSGGPLTTSDRTTLVGVIVFGHACKADRIPDGFGRISFYADWIIEKVCSTSRMPYIHCPQEVVQESQLFLPAHTVPTSPVDDAVEGTTQSSSPTGPSPTESHLVHEWEIPIEAATSSPSSTPSVHDKTTSGFDWSLVLESREETKGPLSRDGVRDWTEPVGTWKNDEGDDGGGGRKRERHRYVRRILHAR